LLACAVEVVVVVVVVVEEAKYQGTIVFVVSDALSQAENRPE